MGTCTLQWEVALFGFDMLSMGTRGKAGTCSQKLHPKSTPYSCVTPSKSFELSRPLFPKGIIFPSRILFFFKLALFGVRGTMLLGFQPFAPYGQGSSLWSVLHTEGADRPSRRKNSTAAQHLKATGLGVAHAPCQCSHPQSLWKPISYCSVESK